MTNASYICSLMGRNPEYWRDIIKGKRIFIKEEGPLAIFNYDIKAKFNDPVVREARGIIINTEKKEVVCWPFTKFTGYDHKYADTIDWEFARAEEKIDGSIIKLWYNELEQEWCFSTNSMIHAEHALCELDTSYSFMSLIKSTRQYPKLMSLIESGLIQKDNTYIFEIVSPLNQQCIKYANNTLYHIGTKNNITGEEISGHLKNFPYPVSTKVNSLEDCINLVNKINIDSSFKKINSCKFEGFVVVDKNWNRIKVKTPIYLILHDILSCTKKSKMLLLQMIHEGSIDVGSICDEHPEVAHIIKYYDFKYSELKHDLNLFINKVRILYAQSECDKEFNKILSSSFNDNKLYMVLAYKAIKNNEDIFTIMETFNKGALGVIEKLIATYKPNKYEIDWKKYKTGE